MLHLLKLEWLKQKDYILFRILIIAYIFFLPSILFIGKKIPPIHEEMFDPQLMLFHFPSVWEFLAYIGNWLVFFIFGFMAVLIITNEHSYRTMRQNILAGVHRSEWFWSKVLFIVVISLFASLYYALCSIVIGVIHGMDDTLYLATILKNSGYTIRYFLMCIGYMSFGMLVGLLVKRTGIALFAFIGYPLFLEPVMRGIHFYYLKHHSMQYFPLNIFEDLCPIPLSKIVDELSSEMGFPLIVDSKLAISLAVGYILLFSWLSYKRLTKSDL